MGCYAEVDAITGLGISCNDEVVAFYVQDVNPSNSIEELFWVQRRYTSDKELADIVGKECNSVRAEDFFKFWEGTYNDYGNLNEIDILKSISVRVEDTPSYTVFYLSKNTYDKIIANYTFSDEILSSLNEDLKKIYTVLSYMRLVRASFPYAPGNYGNQGALEDSEYEAQQFKLLLLQEGLNSVGKILQNEAEDDEE